MFNYLNLNKEININQNLNFNFLNEKIYVDNSDYYFSNVIARSSKTMVDCDNAKKNLNKTGTEG